MSSWERTRSVGVTHMINDGKNLVSSSSCTRERLKARRGLAKAKCSNHNSKKNLNEEQKMWLLSASVYGYEWLNNLVDWTEVFQKVHLYLYCAMRSGAVHNCKWKLSITGLLISDIKYIIVITPAVTDYVFWFMDLSQMTTYIKPLKILKHSLSGVFRHRTLQRKSTCCHTRKTERRKCRSWSM